MSQKCLVIADDLTGGADTGAQFAKNGLSTFLISFEESRPVDFLKYDRQDVLVINTDSRGLKPKEAVHLVSSLLKSSYPDFFPVIYKKIDSTLRGNIGYEIDALIQETNAFACFVAPSYPEQERTVVNGTLLVGGRSLASSEISDGPELQESHICNLLKRQSRNSIGWIGLKEVTSGGRDLRRRVDEEARKGTRILVFDAVSRQDLRNISDLAFRMEKRPLLAGSAGLAKEVAQALSSSKSVDHHPPQKSSRFLKQVFIISGSASSVTHRQLKHLAAKNVPEFTLPLPWLTTETLSEIEKKEFSDRVAIALSKNHVILRSPPQFPPKDLTGLPIHLKITKMLAALALSVMQESEVDPQALALVLTGGETAMSLVRLFQAEGITVEGELLEGIMKGYLVGGKWGCLTVVTKAGAFGKEDTLKNILEILKKEPRACQK